MNSFTEKTVTDLFYEIPLMREEQFLAWIMRTFGTGRNAAEKLMLDCARRSIILLSKNHWATSPSCVNYVFSSKHVLYDDSDVRVLPELEPSESLRKIADAFWIALKNLPSSSSFISSSKDFSIIYTDSEMHRTVEVLSVTEGTAYETGAYLRKYCCPSEDRDIFYRIAVLHGRDTPDGLRGCGFAEFYSISYDEKGHVHLFLSEEVPENERWQNG